MTTAAALLLAATLAAQPGDGIANTYVHGNQLFAEVFVEEDCGQPPCTVYEALVVLTFKDIGVVLDPTLIAIYAVIIDPADPAIRARLPNGAFIPARFPVLININKASLVNLSFANGYEVELVTRHLEFGPNSPFRLFKSPDGGNFANISSTVGYGSYRVRGSSGEFSEFVVAADLAPADKTVEDKIGEVQALVDQGFSDNNIDVASKSALETELGNVSNSFNAGENQQAILDAESLLDVIDSKAGSGIDNTYNGLLDTESTAGNLTAAVESLRFALELFAARKPESTDILRIPLTTGSGRELVLRVAFESAQALELDNLTAQAFDVDPLDPALLARLPTGGTQVQIPAEFPVLIHVDPGANDEQAFRGEVRFEVETDELALVGETRLRLFKAKSAAHPFSDITETYGLGSYRVRGPGAQFSQLMVLEDNRPNNDVLVTKYSNLRTALETHENKIDAGVYAVLLGYLDAAETAYNNGNYAGAEGKVKLFIAKVENEAGKTVPAIWHITETPGGTRTNVAALLLGIARSLAFSLEVVQAPVFNPADVDRNGVVDELDVFYVINQVYSGAGGGPS